MSVLIRQRVWVEAFIVGIGLIAIFHVVQALTEPYQWPLWSQLFISGVSFHLICEFTGVNQWYADHFQ